MPFFLFLLVLITVLVLPVVLITVIKVVPRMIERSIPAQDRTTPELESRLVRIEEAIDAMAVEIERLRTGEVEAMSAARRLPRGEAPASERDA